MSVEDPVVIVSCARSAMASFQGDFAQLSAPQLGGETIAATMSRCGIEPDAIDEVLMGCVLQAGIGQAPARQAALYANVPRQVGCTTINKMCGSGMKATMLGYDLLRAKSADVVMCGGMESMTNAPYLLDKARGGYRIGHQRLIDHMFHDGLEDPFVGGGLMGCFAEDCAEHYQFTREAQDAFAVESLLRAKRANDNGSFSREIVPITVKDRRTETVVANDEQPAKANLDKIPSLQPAFRDGGTVTAANSSSISDGAASLLLTRASHAELLGVAPQAKLLAHATVAQDPAWFTTAPIGAITKLLEKLAWTTQDVDLFEINEAFAVVAMAAMRDLKIPHEKLNVHGGACALGHPIGASGARILVTLLHALQKYDLKTGVGALCIGGGEATAVAIERFS